MLCFDIEPPTLHASQYYNTSEGTPEIRPRGLCLPGNLNCFVVPYGFFSTDLSRFG